MRLNRFDIPLSFWDTRGRFLNLISALMTKSAVVAATMDGVHNSQKTQQGDFRPMLKGLALHTTFTVLLLLASAASANADPILNVANGHYYEAFSGTFTWLESRDAASSLFFLGYQGHLATITSQAEQDFINSNMPLSALGSKDEYGHWIGGYSPTPTTDPRGFAWITGEPFVYTNWSSGEPNSGQGASGPQAIHFHGGPAGAWNDATVTEPHGYIVEFDVPISAVPEPASLTLLIIGFVGVITMKSRRSGKTYRHYTVP